MMQEMNMCIHWPSPTMRPIPIPRNSVVSGSGSVWTLLYIFVQAIYFATSVSGSVSISVETPLHLHWFLLTTRSITTIRCIINSRVYLFVAADNSDSNSTKQDMSDSEVYPGGLGTINPSAGPHMPPIVPGSMAFSQAAAAAAASIIPPVPPDPTVQTSCAYPYTSNLYRDNLFHWSGQLWYWSYSFGSGLFSDDRFELCSFKSRMMSWIFHEEKLIIWDRALVRENNNQHFEWYIFDLY